MCLADTHEREPLPALITFPTLGANAPDGSAFGNAGAFLGSCQDVMGFRLQSGSAIEAQVRQHRRDMRSEGPALVCSAGLWSAHISQWSLRSHEREYCRVVQGRVRVADRRGRQWEFLAGSAFLLLRGFDGSIEVIEPAQIAYMVFSLPDGCALDWCMVSEGRTALGQERLMT